MFLIEIACPQGALDAEDRSWFADSIVAGLTGSESESAHDTPEETLRRARAMTHVGFRELIDWTTGDGPWKASAVPPLWLTITVPEAWREEMSRHVIGWIRRAVRELDGRHGWQRKADDLWVNLTGVADGSIGLGGKPSTADDVLDHLTEEFRANRDHGRPVPEGRVVDPICGMLVRLGPRSITLEHDGETLGFCAEACRDSYARRYASSDAP